MGRQGGIIIWRTSPIRPGTAALPRQLDVNRIVLPVHLYVREDFQSCSLQRRIPEDAFVKGGFRVRGCKANLAINVKVEGNPQSSLEETEFFRAIPLALWGCSLASSLHD